MSLAGRPLREQAAAVASGDADPVELLEDTLALIERRNPELNAIVDTFPEQSRQMLDQAPRGPLYGVPVAIKDEWPLPWRAERLGMSFAPGPPGESGPYLALRDAGAVIVGVANMHELGTSTAGNESAYGAARNPWNTERCAGGSSSGSSAAVGGRLLAAAVSADGVGSIRVPASYCGITGLKPTFGRSTMAGHHAAKTTRTIVSGPSCVDAADARLFAAALFGEPELSAGDAAGLRIGTIAGPIAEDCQAAVREACEDAIEKFRAETGGTVSEVEVEGLEHAGLGAILTLLAEDLADVTPGQAAGLGEAISLTNRALLKYRLIVPASTVRRAERLRAMVRRALVGVFEQVDVLAWPTSPGTAPPLDHPALELPSGHYAIDAANSRQVGIANLTGIPGINIPVGRDPEGMPIGLQLLGHWGRDELLLDAAEAFERASGREHVEALPALAA